MEPVKTAAFLLSQEDSNLIQTGIHFGFQQGQFVDPSLLHLQFKHVVGAQDVVDQKPVMVADVKHRAEVSLVPGGPFQLPPPRRLDPFEAL